jgi:L-gulonolactone oxidase
MKHLKETNPNTSRPRSQRLALRAGLLTAMAASLSCGRLASSSSLSQVPNYSGSIVCNPSEVLEASNVSEIQAAVQRARSLGKQLTTISLEASRSYSEAICPEDGGILLKLAPLNKILSVDPKSLSAVVEPGVIVGDLQESLNGIGLAFPVTPDYNGISVAGGMGAGAHNSSLRIPTAIGDWVQEVKVVDGRGETRVLTGDELDAARVHLGLLGIIYEVKVKLVPQFKLRHGIDKFRDEDLAQLASTLVRRHDYAKINWFPGHDTFFVDSLDKVAMETPGQSFNTFWTSTPDLPVFKELPIRILNSSKVIQRAAEALRIKTWAAPFKAVDSPASAPVGLSHQMIGGTCQPGSCSWDRGVKSRTVEVAFPLSELPRWVADVKEMIKRRPAYFPILGIYLRFSQASAAYLGQASGEDTVFFEIHIPQTSDVKLEPSSEVYDEMVQMTLAKYQGRPHWGKNSRPYFAGLNAGHYPKWDSFVEIRRSLDPEDVFVNPFWKNANATFESLRGPNCGLDRSCICAVDADCGPGARCEAGALFTEARVCLK